MPKLEDVCHQIRSKNAGPFWISVDLFFRDREAFDRYAGARELQPQQFLQDFELALLKGSKLEIHFCLTFPE